MITLVRIYASSDWRMVFDADSRVIESSTPSNPVEAQNADDNNALHRAPKASGTGNEDSAAACNSMEARIFGDGGSDAKSCCPSEPAANDDVVMGARCSPNSLPGSSAPTSTSGKDIWDVLTPGSQSPPVGGSQWMSQCCSVDRPAQRDNDDKSTFQTC